MGGGTITKALAFSKVVRTRLNALPDDDDLGVMCVRGVELDTLRFFSASRSEGETGRDGIVHDEVVDEIEL